MKRLLIMLWMVLSLVGMVLGTVSAEEVEANRTSQNREEARAAAQEAGNPSESGEEVPLEELSTYVSGMGMLVGSTPQSLHVIFIPENTTQKNVTWSSADLEIAEPVWSDVGECYVIPKKVGTTIITATEAYSGITLDFTIEVQPFAERYELSETEVTIGIGQSFMLRRAVFPENSLDSGFFRIDDESIVSMESTYEFDLFKVTGKKIGKTAITLVSSENKDVNALCTVNVVEPVYTSDLQFEQTQIEMEKGETITLNPLVSPSDITCREIEWSTSNPDIADVEDGVVTCVGNYGGKAVITAKALDGSGKEATCTIVHYAEWDKPDPPSVDTFTSTKVILSEWDFWSRTFEYSMDGENWQDSNVFTGLEPDREYTFYRRIKAVGEYVRDSDISDGTTIRIAPAKLPEKDASLIEPYVDLKIGKKFTQGDCRYRIRSETEVVMYGLKNKKAVRVIVPASVKSGGKEYRVHYISNPAFSNASRLKEVIIGENVEGLGPTLFKNCKKLRNITIKSTQLKSVEKNTFKGLKTQVKIKVPARKYGAYKKLLKGKGQGKKVKIVKY